MRGQHWFFWNGYGYRLGSSPTNSGYTNHRGVIWEHLGMVKILWLELPNCMPKYWRFVVGATCLKFLWSLVATTVDRLSENQRNCLRLFASHAEHVQACFEMFWARYMFEHAKIDSNKYTHTHTFSYRFIEHLFNPFYPSYTCHLCKEHAQSVQQTDHKRPCKKRWSVWVYTRNHPRER